MTRHLRLAGALVLVALVPISTARGADPVFDLSITTTDGVSTVLPGGSLTYTITARNAGPDAAIGASVIDFRPDAIASATWTCVGFGGGTCVQASGVGADDAIVEAHVDLPPGGGVTVTVSAEVASDAAAGQLTNTADIAIPPGEELDATNNSASDTDRIVVPPSLGILDSFDRANANSLGSNWSQTLLLGLASIRVNNQQAQDPLLPGSAIWNGPGNVFGSRQGAAFGFANAPGNGRSSLVLKASGGSAAHPASFIRVGYGASAVVIGTTTNGGLTITTRATFTASFAVGDVLSATAESTGTVTVFKTSGATTSLVGIVTIPTAGAGAWTQGTGGGRIGIQLPTGVRIDDFAGGTLP